MSLTPPDPAALAQLSQGRKTMRASEPSDGAERQDLREVRDEKAPRI